MNNKMFVKTRTLARDIKYPLVPLFRRMTVMY